MPGNAQATSRVLELLDAVTARLAALTPRPVVHVAPAAGGGAASRPQEPRVASPKPPLEAARTLRADVAELDGLVDGIAEVGVRCAAVRRAAEGIEKARQLAGLLSAQYASTAEGSRAFRQRAMADELDRILASTQRELMSALDQTDREVYQVRDAAARLRLVPARAIFDTLERAARDAAVSLGKRVVFEGSGGHMRLDADVLGAVQSALVQAVRNAVAHGIESEVERHRSGKPGKGGLPLRSYPAAIASRSLAPTTVRGSTSKRCGAWPRSAGSCRGTQTGSRPRRSSVSCWGAGFSTSLKVSEIAGRGVGLDVVREVAERLGGGASLRTTPQKGTVLELEVPVSLSSVDALQVEVSGALASIPLAAVKRTSRVAPGDIARSPEGDSMVVNGNIVPFTPLELRGRISANQVAVLLETRRGLAVVGVDRVVGTRNILLRPLPPLTPHDPTGRRRFARQRRGSGTSCSTPNG